MGRVGVQGNDKTETQDGCSNESREIFNSRSRAATYRTRLWAARKSIFTTSGKLNDGDRSTYKSRRREGLFTWIVVSQVPHDQVEGIVVQ